MTNKIIKIIIAVVIFILIAFGVKKCVNYMNYTEAYEYDLEEIRDGKYVIYQRTVSSIHAENYEMVTVCANGNVTTFKGKVDFVLTENENNRVKVVSEIHRTHGDRVIVYTTKEKIEYADTITIY